MAIVIDASGAVMGRLASHVAKRLLEGEEIVLVHAEEAVITGSRDNILEEYRHRRSRGTQRFGPYYPRVPHMILKRAVRGMLPYQTPRGRAALQRLRVEVGLPAAYARMTLTKAPEAARTRAQGLTIAEVSEGLGYTRARGASKARARAAPKPGAEKKVKA
jgi:large subunit ribosomal protein L13